MSELKIHMVDRILDLFIERDDAEFINRKGFEELLETAAVYYGMLLNEYYGVDPDAAKYEFMKGVDPFLTKAIEISDPLRPVDHFDWDSGSLYT